VAAASVPIGLDRGRHCDLDGRGYHVWVRRVGLIGLAVFPLLGLLNVFGQRAAITEGSAPAAQMSVNSPARLRGGLLFTTEIVVRARKPFSDVRLLLAPGWFEGMTYNAVAPQPTNQTSSGGSEVFEYGTLSARQTLSVWIYWQVNPTNVGRHVEDVLLYDGPRHILTIPRSVEVFP
jgi:hypothetical protein